MSSGVDISRGGGEWCQGYVLKVYNVVSISYSRKASISPDYWEGGGEDEGDKGCNRHCRNGKSRPKGCASSREASTSPNRIRGCMV